MKFFIKRVDNGWMARLSGFEDSDDIFIVKETNNVEDFADFLSMVFRYHSEESRYSPERLHIFTMPGDKYEGTITEAQREKYVSLREELDELLGRNT